MARMKGPGLSALGKKEYVDGFFTHYNDGKARRDIVPVRADVEITSACNFRCVHCQVSYPSKRKRVTTQEVISVLDQLADIGTPYLNITGGESLIHPDLFFILEHAKRRDFVVQLSTNGSLVTREIARRLAKLFLNNVCVSIYGMDEESYKKVTCAPGVYRKVIENVKLMIACGVRVVLRMPLMAANIAQIKKFEKFAASVRAGVRSSPWIHARFDRCQAPLKYQPTLKQTEDFLRAHPELIKPKFFIGGPDQGVCSGSMDQLGINAYGDVAPCGLLSARADANIRRHPIAFILENNPYFKTVNKIKWRDVPACMNCKALVHCRPCPGYFQLETGSLTRPGKNSSCRLAWLKKRLYEETGKI